MAFIGGKPQLFVFPIRVGGCLRSQRGRRPLHHGVSAKLYSGGGEDVVHSASTHPTDHFPPAGLAQRAHDVENENQQAGGLKDRADGGRAY